MSLSHLVHGAGSTCVQFVQLVFALFCAVATNWPPNLNQRNSHLLFPPSTLSCPFSRRTRPPFSVSALRASRHLSELLGLRGALLGTRSAACVTFVFASLHCSRFTSLTLRRFYADRSMHVGEKPHDVSTREGWRSLRLLRFLRLVRMLRWLKLRRAHDALQELLHSQAA